MTHAFATLARRVVLPSVWFMAASTATAQDTTLIVADNDFYKTKNCLACHHPDRRGNGPAFRSVAAKYVGVSGAEARLALKVRAGGGGVWGPVAMPAQTQVSEAEAVALVRWILALRTKEEEEES